MTTLYVASTNAGKLRDFFVAAQSVPPDKLEIATLPGLNTVPPAPEEGETFEENARSKAIYYSRRLPGEIVLADDSGLEVDALQGGPGVRSARYAADNGVTDTPDSNDNTDVWNNIFLLSRLREIPAERRAARYRCVLAAARDGECLFTSEGTVEGEILSAPRGTGGFGYDPLFYLPTLNKTMAELDLETKHTLSHRGRAFRSMLVIMRDVLG